ncbi:MAG: bifunctional phosphopantothenoylcysteine decarboxylase/phosphopantothenate--cysteine ligase CoaBC [Candidatus Hydrogenedentes bacterium]|nr:bifunctional phosphopantothenoylcysteine decarboxylase/phosphopantothenate--cysteine ligase CoaBC [Candidatus Hydrogenedentota bacterium]
MITTLDKTRKRVLLGVTGSIAAYKACEIASTLTKAGLDVIPVLTDSALEFVGAATFEGITHNRAITRMFESAQNASMDHIELAQHADLFLIAPATANMIAKAAQGIADDWLTTALLVTRAPVLFAPAMNTNMYQHPAVQENLRTLRERGCHFVGPDSGVLACKTVGIGRMMDPPYIVEAAMSLLYPKHDLVGKTVLLTTGGNHEPIDPVRFIGNRSSGKMGHALAQEALDRGAEVTVITGPAEVQPPEGVTVIRVQTALEMGDALLEHFERADVVVAAAAVADYRVAEPATEKHKRNGGSMTLTLVENPDLIARAAAKKRAGQVVVGFAAETSDLERNAQAKLVKKNLDLIVANEVGTPESGFGTDTIRASIIDAGGRREEQSLSLSSKAALAERLFDRVVELLGQKTSVPTT